MYNKYLSIFAIILSVIGTIVAILSILKMRLKDVIDTRYAISHDTAELSTLRQVYDARVGTVLVIISGLIQILKELFDEITCVMFGGIIIINASISIIWWISMYIIYRKGRAKLIADMPEEIKKYI